MGGGDIKAEPNIELDDEEEQGALGQLQRKIQAGETLVVALGEVGLKQEGGSLESLEDYYEAVDPSREEIIREDGEEEGEVEEGGAGYDPFQVKLKHHVLP